MKLKLLTFIAALACATLAAGAPLIHWKLDESSGTEAIDSSGNEIHGTWEGTLGSPGWMAGDGIDGGSLFVSGANADTFINDAFVELDNTPFTISTWVKTEVGQNDGVVYLGDGTSGNTYYVVKVNGNVRVNARNGAAGGGEVQLGSVGAANDGEWHHIVGVYASPTERHVYLDGVLEGTSETLVEELIPTRFGIGGLTRNTPHNPVDLFTGQIDDVSLWSRVFTDADAAGLNGLGVLGAGNAADLDTLMSGYTGQMTVQIRGADWDYTTGLVGEIGAIGGTVLARDAFIVLDTLGNGMQMKAIPGNPVVESFSTDSTVIFLGDDAELSWSVNNATGVSINQGVGPVANPSGVEVVTPIVTTTYTLEATNGNGSTLGQVTVTVIPEPVINSFTASEIVIFEGDELTLSWDVENFTFIDIEPDVGEVTGATGSVMVSPTESTLYTLTADNDNADNNISFAEIQVTVYPPLPPRELLLHWPLDEEAGSVVAEDLAGDNPGDFLETGGTIARIPGLIGSGAVTFPNLNDVAIRAYTQLVDDYPFVISGWIKLNGTGNDTFAVLGTGANGTYYSMRADNGVPKSLVRNGGLINTGNGASVDDGLWHSVVGVFTHPASRSIYVDGVLVQEGTNDSGEAMLATVDRFAIGALARTDTSVVDAFDGSVDDTSFWRGVLSASEVAVIHGGATGLGLNASDVASLMTGFDATASADAAGVTWNPVSGLPGLAGETSGSLPAGASIVMDDLGNGMSTGTGGGGDTFQIISIERDLTGTTLVWESEAEAVYSIEFSSDLVDWSDNVATGVMSQGATTSFKDTDAGRLAKLKGFYRVLR